MQIKRLLTDEERKEIVELYNARVPVKTIMVEYRCCRQTVNNIVNRAMVYNKSYTRQKRTIVYPNIDRWLISNNISIFDFAKMCGREHRSIWKNLVGDTVPTLETRNRICKATGLDHDIAFQRCD